MTSRPAETPHPEIAEVTAMIAHHQAGIWRYLRSIGCDHSLADDLTQETFLAVLRRPFHQVSPSATSCYLRRVAYHLLVSYRRRHKKVVSTSELDLLDSQWLRWAGADGDGGEVMDVLTDCFSRLTKRAQHSLKMRFSQDATREQIAKELGITEHGAKNLMQRAKSQLRECVSGKLNRE